MTLEDSKNIQIGDSDDKKEELSSFSIEILNYLKDVQQQHGLRHGDFQRYRGYCSRRIARLRKVLKLPQGDRRHFKRRDVQDTHINNPKSDERYLFLPLMLAERSWAYAMQLRQESNTEQRKKFHLVKKLRKACTYALQLEELCKLERCDARTKLEAQAYVAWIHGTLHFELRLWASAAENLTKAKMVYEKLSSALPEDKQLSYRQRIEELAPSLRYCAYNSGEDKEINLSELRTQGILEDFDKFVLESKEKAAVVLHELEWYGMKVPIRNERIQVFLQSLKDLDESIKKTEANDKRIEMLEKMFIDLRDVITLVREDTAKDNQLLLNYLLSIRIERTIQRNIFLIQQTRKPQDIVRLFEIIMQQLNEFAQLEPLQDKQEIQGEIERKNAAYRALRSFYIAKSLGGLRRFSESNSFFERSLQLAKEAVKHDLPKELIDMLKNVIQDVPYEITVIKASAVLEEGTDGELAELPKKKDVKNKKPLAERLDEYHENPQYLSSKNPNIVKFPPDMEPVPAKPLFYDLALNFVKFPDLSPKLEEGASGSQKQGGISGFVKGLWGWGGSSKN